MIFIISKCSKSGFNKDVDAKTQIEPPFSCFCDPILYTHTHTHLRFISAKLKLIEGTCSKSSVYVMPAWMTVFAKNSSDLNRNVLRSEVIMMVVRQNAERQQALFSQVNINI